MLQQGYIKLVQVQGIFLKSKNFIEMESSVCYCDYCKTTLKIDGARDDWLLLELVEQDVITSQKV